MRNLTTDAPEEVAPITETNNEAVTQNGDAPESVDPVSTEVVQKATLAERNAAASAAWQQATDNLVASDGAITPLEIDSIIALALVFVALGSNPDKGALATIDKFYGASVASRVSFSDPATFPIGAALDGLRSSLASTVEPMLGATTTKKVVSADPAVQRASDVETAARTFYVLQCLTALVEAIDASAVFPDALTDAEAAAMVGFSPDEALTNALDRVGNSVQKAVTGKSVSSGGTQSPSTERKSNEPDYVTGARLQHVYRDGHVDTVEVISGNGSENDPTLKMTLNGDATTVYDNVSAIASAAVGGSRRNGFVHWSVVS